jgi:hypothetical protein
MTIPAWAFSNQMPHVGHQHIATELSDQRFHAVLAAARTQIAREPHHAIRPFGERRCYA